MAIRRRTIAAFLPLFGLVGGACNIPVKTGWYACDPAVASSCPSGQECTWSAEDGEYRCVETGGGHPECGNDVAEQGEECDGPDLAGATCLSLGYTGGTLTCGAACALDESECARPADCGNGALDPGEACDGLNLGGETCESQGWGTGTLSCSSACRLDPSGCSEPPVCGNGVVEPGESCDDGNTTPCDGCSATCRPDGCGNGVVDCGEACDDGNTASGDGCRGDCMSDETCGNGIVDTAAGEACDDGNTANGDGCSSICRLESCGNGTVEAGEDCDEGGVDTETCNANCTNAKCGDGYVNGNAGEYCDDSGESATCDSDCTVVACGDGMINTTAGEQCDDSNNMPGDGCDSSCQREPGCGDGIVQSGLGEVCDDGNTDDCDGCRGDCSALETGCGDGFVCGAEACDDGVNDGSYGGCEPGCLARAPYCGDGTVQSGFGEVCDDGTNDGSYGGCEPGCLARAPYCGDGTVQNGFGEVCDDSTNDGSYGGCMPGCTALGPRCGDSVVQGGDGEDCDDGGVDTATCDSDCTVVVCGDSHLNLDAGEACDDGGTAPGDGCDEYCQHESCPGELTTLMTGGNSNYSIMFDIVALTDIAIQTFDINLSSGTSATTVEVYYRYGTYSGFQTDSSAWTLAATATVDSAGSDLPTPLNLSLNLPLNAGQRLALYFVRTAGPSIRYTNGTTEGALYSSNTDLEIYEGRGLYGIFGGSESYPRVWNGTIYYCP